MMMTTREGFINFPSFLLAFALFLGVLQTIHGTRYQIMVFDNWNELNVAELSNLTPITIKHLPPSMFSQVTCAHLLALSSLALQAMKFEQVQNIPPLVRYNVPGEIWDLLPAGKDSEQKLSLLLDRSSSWYYPKTGLIHAARLFEHLFLNGYLFLLGMNVAINLIIRFSKFFVSVGIEYLFPETCYVLKEMGVTFIQNFELTTTFTLLLIQLEHTLNVGINSVEFIKKTLRQLKKNAIATVLRFIRNFTHRLGSDKPWKKLQSLLKFFGGYFGFGVKQNTETLVNQQEQ